MFVACEIVQGIKIRIDLLRTWVDAISDYGGLDVVLGYILDISSSKNKILKITLELIFFISNYVGLYFITFCGGGGGGRGT